MARRDPAKIDRFLEHLERLNEEKGYSIGKILKAARIYGLNRDVEARAVVDDIVSRYVESAPGIIGELLDLGIYSSALTMIESIENYSLRFRYAIPGELGGLKKRAYEVAMHVKVRDAQESLDAAKRYAAEGNVDSGLEFRII
jgi:hypothetical protein